MSGRIKEVVFYLGLGSLFSHELDAVSNHEWRVLPLIRALADDVGMFVFVAAHVPLFAIIVALVASPDPRVRRNTRLVISGFLLVHALLHVLYFGHPEYEFSSILSKLLIFGGGLFGTLYLVQELRDR